MSKRYCPKGHDTWVVGRTKRYQCRTCRRESARQYNRQHRVRHPDRDRDHARRRYWAGGAEVQRQYRLAHPEAYKARHQAGKCLRRARKAGVVFTIHLRSIWCGVCRGPLDPDQKRPAGGRANDLATTSGHGRTPLHRAPLIAYARPEHWICNQKMGRRSDAELDAAWWARWFREAYPVLAAAGLAPEVQVAA